MSLDELSKIKVNQQFTIQQTQRIIYIYFCRGKIHGIQCFAWRETLL